MISLQKKWGQWPSYFLLFFVIFFPTTATAVFQKPDVIEKAPELSLFDLAGQKQNLSQYQGQVVLLHFWATWCSSCVQELSELQTLWEKLHNKGLVVIAVAEDSKKSVVAFVKKRPMTFPVWIDQYGKGLRSYKIKGFPTTYLIGRNGYQEGIAFGPRKWLDSLVFPKIEKLLAKP